MSSVYHILDKVPPIYQEDMEVEYEELTQLLIKSGRIRIDTDYQCNFARFTDPSQEISIMVSVEELTDPNVIPHTQNIFKNLYGSKLSGKALDQKIFEIFTDLKKQTNKLVPVNPETKVKLTRLLVQSAHPIVIRWLLRDRVEVYITYSHNIGDMMDMESWKHSGSNSGMQSTDGKNVAVFVSCGGDPFAENSKEHPTQGDGWAAVARLQIIAGQELGHFADIKRDEYGKQITRHSANFSGTKAVEHVRIGRLKDIEICNQLYQELLKAGMDKLLHCEKELKFYHTNKVRNLRVLWCNILQYIYRHKILNYAKTHQNLIFIRRYTKDTYMAETIQAMIEDMKFNLAPVAAVYKRSNPEATEAIACIEALARVPQQANKWGYLTTRYTMQNLYKVYYSEVIPSLIQNYELVTGQKYIRKFQKQPRNLRYYLHKLNFFKEKNQSLLPVRSL